MASPWTAVDRSTDQPVMTNPETLSTRPSRPLKSRAAASYTRRRAGNACIVCRARKTKCDNQRPICGFCAATGGSCRYVDSDPSQLDSGSLAILDRIGQLEKSLRDHIDESLRMRSVLVQVDSSQGMAGVQAEHDLTLEEAVVTFSDPDIATSIFEASESKQLRQQDLSRSYSDSPSEDKPPSAAVLLRASEMSVDSVLKWPVFTKLAPCLTDDLNGPIVEVLTSAPRNSHQASNTGSVLHNLSPDTVTHLVENFLANNHVKNPILDVETLWIYAREFSESGPQWDGRSCLMVAACNFHQ